MSETIEARIAAVMDRCYASATGSPVADRDWLAEVAHAVRVEVLDTAHEAALEEWRGELASWKASFSEWQPVPDKWRS